MVPEYKPDPRREDLVQIHTITTDGGTGQQKTLVINYWKTKPDLPTGS